MRWLQSTFIIPAHLACALALLGCAPHRAATTITGQVFIVTAGRETIKMSLVEVLAYPARVVEQHMAHRLIAADSLRASADAEIAREQAKAAVLADVLKTLQHEANVTEIKFIKSEVPQSEWNASSHHVVTAASELHSQRARVAGLQASREHVASEPQFYLAGLPLALAAGKTDADGKFMLSVGTGDPIILVAAADRQVPTGTERYLWLVRVSPHIGATSPVMLTNDNLALIGDRASMIR